MTTLRTDVPPEVAAPSEPFDLYDQGLQADVATLIDRRRVLQLIGLAGVLTVAACTPAASATASAIASAASSGTPSSAAAAAACAPVIPEETAGPYPGRRLQRTGRPQQSGVVRSDIRTSFGAATGTAEGVPLTIRLTDPGRGERLRAARRRRRLPLALRPRGQLLDVLRRASTTRTTCAASRRPTPTATSRFTSIFPACYCGTLAAHPLRGLPERRRGRPSAQAGSPPRRSPCPRTSATRSTRPTGYEASVTNLAQISLATDMVFGDDGGVHQLATITGTVADGLTVELAVPVNA